MKHNLNFLFSHREQDSLVTQEPVDALVEDVSARVGINCRDHVESLSFPYN
jgi:hypothetical protein